MDKIQIHDLSVRGIIGVHDWEREKKQEMVVNIDLFADLEEIIDTDQLNSSVNYRTVTKSVIHHMRTAERHTLEALAGDIAEICLDFDRVHRVKVDLQKPGALRFSRSVGIVIERQESEDENTGPA